jgi:hypothetical protein
MSEIPFEKFIKKLEKLDKYYLLRQEKEDFIVATIVTIKEEKRIEHPTSFTPYRAVCDKEIATFFLITSNYESKLAKDFLKRKLPILQLNKQQANAKIENITQMLEDFVADNFYT